MTFANQMTQFSQDATYPEVVIVYWCAEDSQGTTEISTENGPISFPLEIGKLYWYATAIKTADFIGSVHVSYAFYHAVEIKETCDSDNAHVGRYTVGYAEEAIYNIEIGNLDTVSFAFMFIPRETTDSIWV